MSVQKSNIEGYFTTYVFGRCIFCQVRKLKGFSCISRLLIRKNILNYIG